MAKQKTAAKTTRKTAARRELIDPRKDRRYVRRGATGQFKESDDVARSLKRGRQQKAKRKVKSGPGIEATDNVFVFFSNRLGCAGLTQSPGSPQPNPLYECADCEHARSNRDSAVTSTECRMPRESVMVTRQERGGT